MEDVRQPATVNLRDSPGITVLLKVLAVLGKKGLKGYLVGGYIRDTLLSRPTADIDLAISGLQLDTARRTADELAGSFVLLDESHKLYRIVLKLDSDKQWHLDLSALRGNIEQDLAERDFTINSVAVPCQSIVDMTTALPLIDPLGGVRDLNARVVRVSGPEAFRGDPVRLLRAIRFAAELNFEIEPATEELMRENAWRIHWASPERLRVELVRILEAPRTCFWLRHMDKVGLLGVLFPELNACRNLEQPKEHHWDVFNHSLETVGAAERLLAPDQTRATDGLLAGVPWTPEIAGHFSSKGDPETSRAALLKLAALLHDVAKPQTRTRDGERWRFLGHAKEGAATVEALMQRLRFSRRETDTVVAEIQHHLRPGQLAQEGLPSRRAIYRFFRDTGEAALDILFLSLADHLATRGPDLERQRWEDHTQATAYVLQQREQTEKLVSPPRLVDGHDLINVFHLPPGPQFAGILEEIREAQAAAEITTRDEALAFVRKRISQGD